MEKDDYRYPEKELGYFLRGLIDLCYGATAEEIEELITIYNNSPSELNKAEKCFLINYVGKGRRNKLLGKEYYLYRMDDRTLKILPEREVVQGNFAKEEPSQDSGLKR